MGRHDKRGKARTATGRALLRARAGSLTSGPAQPAAGQPPAGRARAASGAGQGAPHPPQQALQPGPAGQWAAMQGARGSLAEDILALRRAGWVGATALEKALAVITQAAAGDPARAVVLFRALRDRVRAAEASRAGQGAAQAAPADGHAPFFEDAGREARAEMRNRFFARERQMAPRVQALQDVRTREFLAQADVDRFDQALATVTAAGSAAAFERGLAALDGLEAAMQALVRSRGHADKERDDQERANALRERSLRQACGALLRAKDVPGLERARAALATALADAGKRLDEARQAKSPDDARIALDELEAALRTGREHVAQGLLEAERGGKDKDIKAARRAATRAVAADPDALTALARAPQGRRLLDAMVGNLGSSAAGDGDKAFVACALKARFGLDLLEGDMSTKALPRLYKVLALVPEADTTGNHRLTEIRRDRARKGPSTFDLSRNADSSDSGGGRIVLRVGHTGDDEPRVRYGQSDELPEAHRLKLKPVAQFDRATLHELGHAVDAKLGFMDANRARPDCGGWRVHTLRQVADLAGERKGLYGRLRNLPRHFLLRYLEEVLHGRSPELCAELLAMEQSRRSPPRTAQQWAADPGVRQALKDRLVFERDGWQAVRAAQACQDAIGLLGVPAGSPERAAGEALVSAILVDRMEPALAMRQVELAVPAQPPWQALSTEPAVGWCQAIRSTGSSGLWGQGPAAAQRWAIEGRVYQQVQGAEWVSYELAARSQAVSAYQFRAPAEWFAELYAAFHLGLLPDTHPGTRLIRSLGS